MDLNHSQEPARPGSSGELPSQRLTLPWLRASEEYVSLIVRLWREDESEAGDPPSSWRSEVEHIQSGGHWIFSTLGELESFLSDSLRQLHETQEIYKEGR
ncbi:MAG TPA: hypothetical protein VI776_00815 [Anaerolineales bacterium]|nr:hypothetical protein [Anaerolineales bacterium]